MADPLQDESRDAKKQETLFGPNIGVVATGPDWAASLDVRSHRVDDKAALEEILTPEVVKAWVAKSKETSQPTTTLQALVNLKRPTLRLSPLAPHVDGEDHDTQHHHGLEFEFDCDASKCGIYVHVHFPTQKDESAGSDGQRVLVYESVVPGGFGRVLKNEDQATLELGRFEYKPEIFTPHASTAEVNQQLNVTPAAPTITKKRFTIFRKKHATARAVAGPALAVVDEQAQGTSTEGDAKDKTPDEGVKVTIRLVALDEDGNALASPNSQTTYLHVVRFGPPPSADEEDNRPWVVKVVKREATIGPHTFHLHEIYGLQSHSTTSSHLAPTATLPQHTYPPAAGLSTDDDDSTSECLLCLSSPREVVLLPCRHLVACRECAVNMIEFGAGGTLVHNDSTDPAPETVQPDAPGASGSGNDIQVPPIGETTGTGTVTITVPPPPNANPRRKRKAKGWFCPVCRQQYTSMLRITTIPPEKDHNRPSTSVEETGESPAPAPVVSTTQPESRGLGGITRPGFLRSLSRASNRSGNRDSSATANEQPPPVPTLPPDLERQT